MSKCKQLYRQSKKLFSSFFFFILHIEKSPKKGKAMFKKPNKKKEKNLSFGVVPHGERSAPGRREPRVVRRSPPGRVLRAPSSSRCARRRSDGSGRSCSRRCCSRGSNSSTLGLLLLCSRRAPRGPLGRLRSGPRQARGLLRRRSLLRRDLLPRRREVASNDTVVGVELQGARVAVGGSRRVARDLAVPVACLDKRGRKR